MKINFKTRVTGPYEKVFEAFDRSLFEYLLPKQVRLIRFDGSKIGDIVQIGFPFNKEWTSVISNVHRQPDLCFFTDEGMKLPFGLKYWKHRHIVRRDGLNAVIEDDITFSSGNKWLDFILYPALYLGFYPRRKQYKNYFNNMFGAEK